MIPYQNSRSVKCSYFSFLVVTITTAEPIAHTREQNIPNIGLSPSTRYFFLSVVSSSDSFESVSVTTPAKHPIMHRNSIFKRSQCFTKKVIAKHRCPERCSIEYDSKQKYRHVSNSKNHPTICSSSKESSVENKWPLFGQDVFDYSTPTILGCNVGTNTKCTSPYHTEVNW